MRQQKPWYRVGRGWYVEIRGKQVPLGKHPEGAPPPRRNKKNEWIAPACIVSAFHQAMTGEGKDVDPEDLHVANVCDLFLAHVCPYEGEPPKKQPKASEPQPPLKATATHDVRTYWWYRDYLNSFCKLYGGLPALDVKPLHVTAWLDAHPKWTTSRRCAVICLKRVYNWAEGEGLLPGNPMKKVKKPAAVRRERIVTEEEWQQLVGAVRDQEFRDFLFAMRQTGCRPGEVRKVTAAQVDLDLGIWIIEHHKTRKKTGVPRVVYLTPPMVELCRRLRERWPGGPIFRGPKRKGSKPFSRNAVRCRFMRLRKKLPHLKGVISYTLRHSFVTDALERGVPVATVAELVGHKDLKMIAAHYGHLSEKRAHLAEAARRAAGCVAVPPEERRPA